MRRLSMGRSGARRGLLTGAAIAATALSMLVLVAPASAVTEGHVFSFAFGAPGSGNGQFSADFGQGVAVDEDTGDIYVSDSQNKRIQKFDADGNFLSAWGFGVLNGANAYQVCNAPATCQAGTSGAAPGQFINPTGLVVDNTGGPNDGILYVADTGGSCCEAGVGGRGDIQKFSSDGTWLGVVNGEESSGGKFSGLTWNGAIALDKQGFLYVTTAKRVMKFSNEPDSEYIGGSEWENGRGVFAIGVNSSGSRLMVHGGVPSGNYGTYIINSNGTSEGPTLPCGDYFGGGITFDQRANHFLIGNGGSICEFTQAGAQVGQPFGSGDLSSVAGIAVDNQTGKVFAVDWASARVAVFVPRVVAAVTTEAATDIGRTTATLTGHVTPDPDGGGGVIECHFEYGTDQGYGSTVPCEQATPIATGTSVSADVSGLTMDQEYHFRLVASNSIDANEGEDETFTPRRVLGLETKPPSDETPTSATLNGAFDPDGEATTYRFEWGETSSYGNTTPVAETEPTSGTTNVSAVLEGLTSYAQYHYRIVATNSFGTSHGEDQLLRTAPPMPPGISGTAVAGVTDIGAALSATVTPNLGTTIYRFQYGTSTAYGSATPASEPIDADQGSQLATAQLSSLQSGTTYHARLLATNFGGTTAGPDIAFTTKSPPSVLETTAADVSTDAATLRAIVAPGFSPTTYHFEYGPTGAYGASTPESPVAAIDGLGHAVAAGVGGLGPAATYHFRVVATNGIGTATGPDATFRTAARPKAIDPPPPRKCKKGFVKKRGKCVKKKKSKKHKKKRNRR